ncbi:MFS transporter [Solirubrobacter sp. CPCC 204708]|uniref:MFS transporter n=1 Tax=Solirubrobacter deserti TaxID=2282478 RepID=A0ABT4RMU0_9ACTN|nr:MFS transporter [Solirubrobacter deserti]MBE2320139.1 MFS transporter [Solirubrobacter deserti]MDA0139859.1 MFS transporter [Solirubrobacter deserti]
MRTLVPALPRDAWVVLGADAISAVGSGLTLPFLFVYLHQACGLSPALAGLAVASVAAGSVAGNVAGGTLSDRAGARNAMVVGLVCAAAGAAALTLVDAPWHAFAAAVTVGFGAGIVWPAQDALLARVVAPAQRSSAFSLRFATMNAGLGVGALIAALLVSSQPGFVALYLADAASFLVAIPLLLNVRPLAPPVAEHRTGSYRAVVRDRTFVRVWLLTALLVTLSYGQLHSAFPAFASGPGGLDADALGFAYAANTITVVLVQLFVLRALRGRRRTTGIAVACGVWALAWALALFAGQLGGSTPATVAFALSLAVFGLAEACLSPSLAPMVNDLAPADLAGRYNGLSTLAWTVGFLVGPATAGMAVGVDDGALLLGFLVAACGAAALAARRLARHLPSRANTIAAA